MAANPRILADCSLRVAIVGATGLVGQEIQRVLCERGLPIERMSLLASSRSAGLWQATPAVSPVQIHDLAQWDFSKTDVAIFSAGSAVSAQFAPIAQQAGCTVIDNTSHFRLQRDIPLIVTEVNTHRIPVRKKGILIANPNCSTMQLVPVLYAILCEWGLKGAWVTTYQSVSGSGRGGLQALLHGTTGPYSVPIAGNVIPHIDSFLTNGYTKEEMKLREESRKILEDAHLAITATAVRVPVQRGHALAVRIQTKRPIGDLQALRHALQALPGLQLVDDLGLEIPYPTPLTHAAGTDPIYVGRLRHDLDDACGVHAWIVADNLRKGAALNAVQILECWAGY